MGKQLSGGFTLKKNIGVLIMAMAFAAVPAFAGGSKDTGNRQQEQKARQQAEAQAQAEAKQKAAEERQAAIAEANAKGVTAADFTYGLNRDGKGVIISKYKGLATIVTIPSEIEGFPVLEIGREAFADNKDISQVTIPNNVTKIEFWAFRGCTGLTSVTIPNSVTRIGRWAFQSCSNLSSVEILGDTRIRFGNSAFSGCPLNLAAKAALAKHGSEIR